MKHIILGLAFSSALLFMGCEREFVEADHPQTYTSASEDFFFLSATAPPLGTDTVVVNFDEDSVRFDAVLSEEATWVITITGIESGAQKTISGTSQIIDPNSTFWDGSSDNIQFFKPGENVSIKFGAFGTDEEIEATNLIFGRSKKFNGTLITGFEAEGADPNAFFHGGQFNIYFDGDAPGDGKQEGVAYGVFPGPLTLVTATEQPSFLPDPVEGDSYYYISGQDFADQPNDFFIGGFNHDPQRYGITKDLDEVFLNFFVNVNGSETTRVKAEIQGIGGDLFIKEIDVDWEGWRQVSIRLSEFVQTESGTLGLGRLLPEAIDNLAFQIMSGGGEAGSAAEACIDFVILTEDKPFSQLD